MGKVSVIEERLKAINETKFQELCDAYISLKYYKSRAFSRTGSLLGKEKTTKGTPDSFVQLNDGTYLFIESTTQQTGLLEKLKTDISKCLKELDVSISKNKLREIILCFNSKADLKVISELTTYSNPISVKFVTIDDLALQISLHYRTLAKEYLDLPLDSGQIVSLDKFVEQYNQNSQSIATPIDNQLLHRENELSSIIEMLAASDLIVISGSPGIGKTKLAVETIKEFQSRFEYSCFAVLNKDYDILEDLAFYFDNTSKNILFIDDANRFDRLLQIKGFADDAKFEQLKIVLTVRDYALDQIKNLIPEISVFELTPLNEDQIIDIIKNEPFKITNEDYHPKILSISNNNARLAIMAAKLAVEKNNLSALHEVHDLFDEYFKTFVRDNGLLQDKLILKSLGIISYFNTISLGNSDLLKNILDKFQLSRSEFIQSITKLEDIEIVEIKYNHVKIADQSISIYFFYKVFFKDDLLPFTVLIDHFYESTKNRIHDTVIPANNTFGYRNIREKIRPILLAKLKSFSSEKDILTFFDLFWFYLEDELLAIIVLKIDSASYSDSTYALLEPFNLADDQHLKLMFNIIRYHRDVALIKRTTILSFEYTKAFPGTYSQLVKCLTDHFAFDYEDEYYQYQRQVMLFNIIEGGLLTQVLHQQLFFDVANKFLYFRFQQVRPGRSHKFSLYGYTLKADDSILSFRKRIWTFLDKLFPTNPEKAFEVLHQYSQSRIDVDIKVLLSDFVSIDSLIEDYFNAERFDHAYLVQELFGWAKRLGINEHPIKKHQRKFFTEKYKLFRKVDWNRLRDKEQHEYQLGEKYEVVKERELRQSFRFTSLKEYEAFINTFIEIKLFRKDSYELPNSLAIILDENIKLNPSLATKIFKLLIFDKRLDTFSPNLAIKTAANHESVFHHEFWEIIRPHTKLKALFRNFLHVKDNRISTLFDWQIQFLLSLPIQKINREKYFALITVITSLKNSCTLFLDGIEKYEVFKSATVNKVIRIIADLNSKGPIKVALWNVFEKFKAYISDLALLKKTYIQQDRIQHSFDYSGEDLLFILERDTSFLLEYVDSIAEDDLNRRSSDFKSLQIVWELDTPEEIVEQVLNHLIETDRLGLNSDFLSSFFVNVKPVNQQKVNTFILQYISKNFANPKKINEIFELLEDKLKHLFSAAFSTFIRLNNNLDHFKKIGWIGNGVIIHDGSANMGDIRAAKWQRVIELIESEDLGISIIPIMTWVREQLELEKRSADRFREWAYLGEW